MKCPQCKHDHLPPFKLEPNLGAMRCEKCGGVLLDLVAYRLWQELHAAELTSTADLIADPKQPPEQGPEESMGALSCAKCQRIMLKFRYSTQTRHRLDVCSHCDEVWLQEHEWEFLKSHALHGELPKVFTDPWQRKLREQQTRQTFEQQWDQRLGEEMHAKTRDIDSWLREHPRRSAILDYLLAADPYAI